MDDKPTNSGDAAVARLAADEWSVLSAEELRGCGLSRAMIATRVRRRQLHRLHRGIYAVGHLNVPVEGRFLAAVKACGRNAVLSHLSAAALWEMREWEGPVAEVTMRGITPRVHPGIRVHRTRHLDARDRRRHKGIPVTSPARTALDIASQLPLRAARRAVRQGISQRWLAIRDVIEIVERLPRQPGASLLRQIVAEGPAPTRSLLEDVVLELTLAAGLERPDVNVPLVIAGRRLVPDFRWPRRRLIVEADGRRWHDDRLARADDAERQALLEAHGERVIRVSWEQAVRRRSQTVARLRAAAGLT